MSELKLRPPKTVGAGVMSELPIGIGTGATPTHETAGLKPRAYISTKNGAERGFQFGCRRGGANPF
jgi:hypothetical protein